MSFAPFKEVVQQMDPPVADWERAALLTHKGWTEESPTSLDEVKVALDEVRGISVGYNAKTATK